MLTLKELKSKAKQQNLRGYSKLNKSDLIRLLDLQAQKSISLQKQKKSPLKQNIKIAKEGITSLKPNEIFVFGSNLAGIHGAGAARTAHKFFGAQWGVGVGLAGQTYALPTKDKQIVSLPLHKVKKYVDDMYKFIVAHPRFHFIITKVGCGLAGFTPKQMAPLFSAYVNLPNISLPKDFIKNL